MRRLLVPLFAFLLCMFAPNAAHADVNLNTATEAQLESLPGIGPSKAAAIMQYRADHGAFTAVAELDNVAGIGPATMANLAGLVSVGDGATVAASTPASAPATTATSTGHGALVNINTATAGQMVNLPGIGPAKAAAIVAFRDRSGPFKSCEQLDAVEGIGPATLANVRSSCTTGETTNTEVSAATR